MSMDKLFDGSDAHLLPSNAELIERLDEPELYYPGNFDTPERANAILMCLCQEAVAALAAAANRIAELETFNANREAVITYEKARASEAEREALEQARLLGMSAERECDLMGKLDRTERKLAVAREALNNIYQQTQEGATHSLATEALISTRQEAIAQIGGD